MPCSGFDACGAPRLMGIREPIVSTRWITDMESAFLANFFMNESNVKFVVCMFHYGATDWWHEVVQDLELDAVKSMTWENFFYQVQERVCADNRDLAVGSRVFGTQ